MANRTTIVPHEPNRDSALVCRGLARRSIAGYFGVAELTRCRDSQFFRLVRRSFGVRIGICRSDHQADHHAGFFHPACISAPHEEPRGS